MGKLNIAHHKSYHPYRLDNIERVRRDEEEARRKEEGQEDRIRLADSEARLELLRSRIDSKTVSSSIPTTDHQFQESISTDSGHINLFADLEHQEIAANIERSRQSKKTIKAEEEKGIRLGPSPEDLKPWYTDAKRNNEDLPENKKIKDLSSKIISDPLTSITHQLFRSHPPPKRDSAPPTKHNPSASSSSEARIQRESRERARAIELIRKRQKEKEHERSGIICMTPSSVDFDHALGYGDVYNPRETQEAHRRWDRNVGNFGRREKRR
ncbi:hypothetical protein Clacol_007331 [Clathrus columnatus]|uniref:CBF1-interacting co-repressor CIR N-terminal domain-containing protein n=1 Tax=Clathrus columnatus TaxID=1419009 RepID=A0AAV5AEM0_9AGAM|nr:hypothetical protein Clacol_007331 [Clathrus columnatus]